MKIEKEPDYINDFIDFAAELQSRLRAGSDEYGDKSFTSDPMQLLTEIQEELLDVANLSFILHCRLKAIKKALKEV